LQEEERLGQLLLQLADVDADLVIELDPETGGDDNGVAGELHYAWKLCASARPRLYERFNGTVVLRIDAEVQTVVDSAEVRRWVTSYTGWMPFVQARIDHVNRKKCERSSRRIHSWQTRLLARNWNKPLALSTTSRPSGESPLLELEQGPRVR
jgi:hypothetical protein